MKTTPFFIIIATMGVCSSATAAVIFADTADATVRADGSVQNEIADDLITGQTFGAAERSSVIPFQLPDLGAVDLPFLTASFTFNYVSNTNIDGTELQNVDLYAIRLSGSASSAPIGADFFLGAFGSDDTDAIALQDDIITPTSALGLATTDSTANAGLVAYLNTVYDGGNGIGDFVFLRLSLDAEADTNERFAFTSAEGGSEGATHPQINFTAVPEPSSAALLGLGVLGLMTRRRR